MKNEITPYQAPPDEMVFTLPSRGPQPTQVWRVPVEPRMKITRGGEPRRDWPLLLQTSGLLLAATLLPLCFLAQKPAPLPSIPTYTAAKITPAPAPKSEIPVRVRVSAPQFFNPNVRPPPRFTVPPCAPMR